MNVFEADRVLKYFKNKKDVTPDMFPIKKSLSPHTFVGRGTYGKVFKSDRTKLIIKEVLCHSVEDFQHFIQEILIQSICASETHQFTSDVTYASVPPILEVSVTTYTFPLLLHIVTTNAGSPISELPIKTKSDIAKMCGVIYQVANLIDYLQTKFKFCHRDVHGGNVLVQTRRQRGCSLFYKSSLIDFGMARMVYKGVVLAANVYFPSSRFVPGFDMTMLLARTFGEQCILALKCKALPQDLQKALRKILQATNVRFDNVNSIEDLYDFIEEQSVHFKQVVSPAYVKNVMLHFAKHYCKEGRA